MKKSIIVASQNPVKINAAKKGFEQMFPNKLWNVQGISVASEVRDQPITDAETLLGAQNRVKNARLAMPDADFWIGIEGGIDQQGSDMSAFAWVFIQSGATRQAKARSGAFFLPPPITQLIEAGKELGEADDIVFGQSNSKQAGGAVGLLTDNLMDRTQLYFDAVVLALIPFKNANLYW